MMFGEKLKSLRNLHEMTQSELAEILKLSKANISKYENSNLEPNIETLQMISKYFNVSTDYLLGRDEQKEIHPSETDERILKLTSQHKEAERLLDLYIQLSPDQQKTILDLAGVYIAQQEKDNKE